jgi:hypothetical protein
MDPLIFQFFAKFQPMNRSVLHTALYLVFFSIAMGFLESAVVVYLRELYYPRGFHFPLVPMPPTIALTEFLREISTIVMLLAAGCLAGKNARQRFAWFIFCFAVWDIFYYIFLKFLLNWPESLLTWDILFLIPVLWTAPVIAPVIVSVTMILLAVSLLGIPENRKLTGILFFILCGAFMIFISFIWDFCAFTIRHESFSALLQTGSGKALLLYHPSRFNWILFAAGEVFIFFGIYRLITLNPAMQKKYHGL